MPGPAVSDPWSARRIRSRSRRFWGWGPANARERTRTHANARERTQMNSNHPQLTGFRNPVSPGGERSEASGEEVLSTQYFFPARLPATRALLQFDVELVAAALQRHGQPRGLRVLVLLGQREPLLAVHRGRVPLL